MPPDLTPETKAFCITDVGSTTTKACLFRKEDDGPGSGWGYLRREAATTVERPDEDVSIGMRQSLDILTRESGLQLLYDDAPTVPYLATSSAGGGLAMVVTGLVREITSRSAERVALGAGALLLDVIALDDGRTPYEKIVALRAQTPDMILLAGGFEGSALSQPVFLAELLNEAAVHPRRNPSVRLPVVYAGNSEARPLVGRALGDRYLFHPVQNIRPDGEHENLEPARQAIQDLFMEHVMSQAPGYETLRRWTSTEVMPTPAAVGRILALASRQLGGRILAVDIGGATTDVFTAEYGRVQRSVSANLGMSYSILNVVRSGGMSALKELLDPSPPESDIWDIVGEKLLNPTRLPQTSDEANIERAVATLAMRAAVAEHLQVIQGTPIDLGEEELGLGTLLRRGIGRRVGSGRRTDGCSPERIGRGLKGYDLIIGSGGVLSHSPRPIAARMLIDAVAPSDRGELAVDTAFIFPHLGILSSLEPELASTLFETMGLVRLGTVQEYRRSGEKAPAPAVHPRAPSISKQRVEHGPIRLRRELAIPGEVFVRPGQDVEPDTVVARSTRLFLRPFFLRVSGALGLGSGDPTQFLLTQVGEDLEVGQLVAQRKTGLLRSKEFRSPVAGTVERLLPDGTLVVRERAERAVEVVTVRAAAELGLPPGKLAPLLICRVGQEVDRGQLLVGSRIPAETPRLLSPVRGRVRSLDLQRGTIQLAPLREALEVRAWLPGRVREVSDHGCLIESHGSVVSGAWGRGGEAWGSLSLEGPVAAGAALVREMATQSVLEEAIESRASGLISAGGRLSDLLVTAGGPTVVLTEGFGPKMMEGELRDLLLAHGEGVVLLDGTTELRSGVVRPRIILPDP